MLFPDCYDRKDIIFVIDSSEQVERDLGLPIIQNFLVDVINTLRVDPSATRIGVLLYGDDVYNRQEHYIELDRYRDGGQVIDAIRGLQSLGGQHRSVIL